MITYDLGLLPLIRDLRTAHPSVNQPWYPDDSGEGGTFTGIQQHLDDLMVQGPLQGYFPEQNKSILVVSPWNSPRAEAFFRGYVLKIVKGIRYLGGFMGAEVV